VTRHLEFGIFDWLEYQPDIPLADTFEDRLRMLMRLFANEVMPEVVSR